VLKLLECSGNLFDSTVLATKLALSKAKLPRLVVRSDDEGDVSLEVPDDPNAVLKLNIDNVPNSVSVCKIGHNYVVDADLKEECVVKVKLILGFDKNGCVRYTSKYGFGSLDPDTIYSMIDVSSPLSVRSPKLKPSTLRCLQVRQTRIQESRPRSRSARRRDHGSRNPVDPIKINLKKKSFFFTQSGAISRKNRFIQTCH
jgi:hypothetical protein